MKLGYAAKVTSLDLIGIHHELPQLRKMPTLVLADILAVDSSAAKSTKELFVMNSNIVKWPIRMTLDHEISKEPSAQNTFKWLLEKL